MALGIVLVHGYSGSPDDLRLPAERLKGLFGEDSVTVVVLPGYERGRVPLFDERQCGERVASAVEWYTKEGRDIILLGHSTGGALALSYMAARSFRPRLLVLAAVPKKIDAAYLGRWNNHRSGRPEIPFSSVAGMVSLVNRTGSFRFSGSFSVLAIHGEEDELVPASHAREWEQGGFEGPVRTALIPKAGHQLFHGAGSDMTVDVVARAIADAAAPPLDGDEHVVGRLIEVEPESERFLTASPASARHLARSACGQSVIGRVPELSDRADIEPVLANIEITTRCNLSCMYCARSFQERQGEDMPLGTFRRVLSLLPHAYRVTLVGLGEPLLHPRITTFVAEAVSQGRRVGLVTNAMRLDRPLAQELLAAGLHSIAFSIDAPDQDLASEIRPGTDLEKVIGNIKSFLELAKANRPMSTAVFTAVSTKTVPFLEELIDVIAGLGVHVLMMTDLNFEENQAKTVWKNVDAAMTEAVRRAVARAFSKKLPVLSVHGLEELGLTARYDQFLLLPPDSLFQRSKKRTWCFSPWQTVPVNVRGEVTVCDCRPEKVAGNILSQPFSGIWNGETMMDHRRHMLGPDPPGKCRLCPRF
jgi:MoaA/NifB/PqqE/SkfB family radical SAM enzyme/pimeloyl-ACP methyl ester carboxylesterase